VTHDAAMKTLRPGRPVTERVAVNGPMLKALRRDRGWPAWDLAARIATRLRMTRAPGVATIYGWENESCRPPKRVACALAQLFHVPMSVFLR